jgi:Ca-activated chloride channel homolog
MTRRIERAVVVLLLVFAAGLGADAVRADAPPTGTIQGRVTYTDGPPLAGATIVVTSPALQGSLAEISDDDGRYEIRHLAPGTYQVEAYFGDLKKIKQAVVRVGQISRADFVFDPDQGGSELIIIESRAPLSAAPSAPAPGGPPAPPGDRDDDGGDDSEEYDRIEENPFVRVASRPLSTFSIDVDTASYANTRRFLRDGNLPPRDSVRIEELINYFHYHYKLPKGDDPFSITSEVGPSPWHPGFKLVRLGLQAPAIPDSQVPARNLVFLLDVSGSMDAWNKLPLLKQAMGLLVETLRPQDRVAIVVYAGASGVALPSTSGALKQIIRAAIGELSPGGSTNGAEGLELAYQLAQEYFIPGGINRVVLCTDGDFNVGVTSQGALTRLIEQKRKAGVFLSVLGFGTGNVKDATMENLADKGNGNYAYIDSIDEARKVLVKEAGATLVTVAKDVKIQVEMNPALVAGYRLIGYENRLLRDEDFNDDTKDAGEIGAGHAVTALYEIVPAGVEVPAEGVDGLKYQRATQPRSDGTAGELMTVKVRYKAPDSDRSKLLARVVPDADVPLARTTRDFRWAAAVAGFGMMLRESPHRGPLTWAEVLALAKGAATADPEGYRQEMLGLIEAASKLSRTPAP